MELAQTDSAGRGCKMKKDIGKEIRKDIINWIKKWADKYSLPSEARGELLDMGVKTLDKSINGKTQKATICPECGSKKYLDASEPKGTYQCLVCNNVWSDKKSC